MPSSREHTSQTTQRTASVDATSASDVGRQTLTSHLNGPVAPARTKLETVQAFFANYANPIGSSQFIATAIDLFDPAAVTTVRIFGREMSPGGAGPAAYLASFQGENAFYGPNGVTHSADWGPTMQDGGADSVVATLRGAELSANGDPPRVVDTANLTWTEVFTVDPTSGKITRLDVLLVER
jgi:hypothetical protein